MKQRDAAHLWDIVRAAQELTGFLEGRRFADFVADRLLRLGVERELEITGEAARRVSPEFREAHSDVPWSSIIGLRNVLAHEYGEVKVERIWAIATERAPELVGLLEPLIPPFPEAE